MSDENKKSEDAPTYEELKDQINKDLTEEEAIKKRIEELRRRDPFIYK